MEIYEILVLVLTFLFLLSLGVPISFSIGISSLLTMMLSINSVPSFTTVAQRMATGIDSFALLAIPFFILAGQLMNHGGIARRLIDFAKILVGKLPGGLAFVNIMAAMLFGAISGSAVAAASAIGGFMTPVMEKEGYDKSFSAAVNITSATTGMIIPPSNILIVYSLASGGVSIAALFLAGYIPGILLGLSLMIVAGFHAKKHKYKVSIDFTFGYAVKKFLDAIPSLLLIIIVIGGIVAGYFTATEASAVAVLYALILSVIIYKEVKLRDLPKILLNSSATTAIVMLLVGTSMAMSWVMAYENIPQTVAETLIALSNNKIVILMIINLVLLFVGVFMDMTPAVLIFTPIFLPVAIQLGIDPIHFGIVMVMNLSIGLCTPPVGSVLFVGCSVANLPITKVIRPLIPMFIAMIITLLFVTYLPVLSLYIPQFFGY
ncbi:MAG: TRAP transporter large permease subunit [Bacteroidetes bacterium]|nr:TRAP transporter large permease subunit [Bacteroidota bacterium]MBU1677250.1 TRAP transporter large permease subunit [Bacteroidota bacterium]MBU2505881.1 TRAP transporter large permease subunit [Bacteroidota bacterium]